MSGPAHAYLEQLEEVDEAEKRSRYEEVKVKANEAKKDVDGSIAHAFAWMLETGYGCEIDDPAAARWYEIAVERGCIAAITTMGCREFEKKII